MDGFNFFLLFPTHEIIDTIQSEDDLQVYLEHIRYLIDLADCERGAEVFYSGSNWQDFVSACQVIDSLGSYDLFKPETISAIILQSATNWEDNRRHSTNENVVYRVWDFESRLLQDSFPDTIKEIVEYGLLAGNKKDLLVNIKCTYVFNRRFIPVLNDALEQAGKPTLFFVSYVVDFRSLWNWLLDNRKQRNFNHTDNRHILGHTAYLRGKSPLLGGIAGKARAEDLLKTAIGDSRVGGTLFNFDEEKQCYIRFEFENDNPQNQYHGYHLVSPQTRERDFPAEERIPRRVVDLLDYQKDLEL